MSDMTCNYCNGAISCSNCDTEEITMDEQKINEIAEKVADIVMKRLESKQEEFEKHLADFFWNTPVPSESDIDYSFPAIDLSGLTIISDEHD